MPIDISCASCGGKFRVPDKFAGKRAKCAKCGEPIDIPAGGQSAPEPKPSATPAPAAPKPQPAPAAQQPAAQQPAAQQPAPQQSVDKPEWYMQTEEGEEYGPVTRADLDSWFADGRIDESCQILKEGWEQWKWAEEVFPGLAKSGGAAEANPFAGIGDSGPAVGVAPSGGTVNPFQSPAEPAGGASASSTFSDGDGITPGISRALAETKPWVLFLAILGFIFGGIGALGAVIMLVTALTSGVVPLMLMALVNSAVICLYLAAAYYLFAYSQRIGFFLRGKAIKDLEGALVAQKSFWKLVGICTAVALALYILLFIAIFAMGGLVARGVSQGGF